MTEPYYSLLCWAIRLMPFASMVVVWVAHYYLFRNKYGFISAAVCGYLVGLLSVSAYWSFAFHYAPSLEIQNQIGLKDGAPSAAALIVMPVLIFLSFVVVAPVSLLICDWLPVKDNLSLMANDKPEH